MRHVVWFSCGAASAIAAKLATIIYTDVHIVYCNTLESEHPDNWRFLLDIEKWTNKKIEIIKSVKYQNIDDVFMNTRYMSGIAGARCTTEMKKIPRLDYQLYDDIHIFGYTVEERKRASLFEKNNPELDVDWILIDNNINKIFCLEKLKDENIELPTMYKLGFPHNNCLGCVKATGVGYWNKIRILFPKVFKLRCEQSRLLNVRLVRIGKERIFLDQLPHKNIPIENEQIDCGPVCQTSEK